MARYTPDVKFVASIYPGQALDVRRNYGPSRESNGPDAVRSTLFHLEPVPRGGKPFVLPVLDSFESVRDFIRGQGSKKVYLPNPVPCEEILSDLMTQWTGGLFNVPSGAKPGIMEFDPLPAEEKVFTQYIRTAAPSRLNMMIFPAEVLPKPSLADIKAMTEMQTSYFEYLFSEGEGLYKQNNWKEITNEMRLAAKWLGKSTVWSDESIARASDPCPFCQQIIPNIALVCAHCGRTVREIPAHLAALQTVAPAVGLMK